MKNNGYIRVASAVPTIKIADCHYNADKITQMILKAEKNEVEIICFPELSLTVYTCNDLFYQTFLFLRYSIVYTPILSLHRQNLPYYSPFR